MSLLWFEIKHRLFRLSSLVYFFAYFVSSLLCTLVVGGAFEGVIFNFGISSKLAVNSPVMLHFLIGSMGYLGLLIIAPIFGQSINQDFASGFHQVLFVTPIRKATYFFIRFFGSFVSVIFIFSSIGIGIWVATQFPVIDPNLAEKNRFWFYLAPYCTHLIPNVLVFGALFLSVASLCKKMAPVYVVGICLFTGFMIAESLTGADLDHKAIAALIDPFGMEGVGQVIRYWSVMQQSSEVIPLTGLFLINRLLWGAAGLFFLALGYFWFDPFTLPKEKKRVAEGENTTRWTVRRVELEPNPGVALWQLTLSEMKQVFSNLFFLVILLCGILYLFSISSQVGKMYGTETWPVTHHVLELIGTIFYFFVAIITTYYAGELVWKEREKKVYELVDATPISNLQLVLSKLFCLFLMQIFLLLLVWVSSVLIQGFKGYYHFEWSLYCKDLFFYTLPSWLFTCLFAFFVQTLSPNKYVGHSLVIAYYVLLMFLPTLGFDHHLYRVGVLPVPPYSDMNGYGAALGPYCFFTLYWSTFHFGLFLLTLLLWRRGELIPHRELTKRLCPIYKWSLSGSLLAWIIIGGILYYNTNVLNVYKTPREKEREHAAYEQLYKAYEKKAHPDLTAVSLDVDLFPENQAIKVKGRYSYQNRSGKPIQEILLNVNPESQEVRLAWSYPIALTHKDEKLGVKIFTFEKPLLPDEKLELQFYLQMIPKGFKNEGFSKKIVENGTFFHASDYFPVIGYEPYYELSNEKARKRQGLSERTRLPTIDNREALEKTYFSHEGTWINFEATVSTSPDQIAIAPGYLEKEWQEKGRRYFHYKMGRPILPLFAILSGRYEVARDQWGDVGIEVYYHPSHAYNIARMIYAVKKSLEYYTSQFSPYPFRQVRIIEFPRYEIFAQSLPNTIPYSEGMGFIARVRPDDPTDLDYPFYVTAHEMAHQWWGHQVIGGRVQGATLLSESLAQYSALMVLEKEYGLSAMKKFLKYELDAYLHGRSTEAKRELPLMLNENQEYIHYQKGSLVFYALKDYLGEQVVNQVLSEYIKEVAFQKPPFTRSIELVDRFRAAASPELKDLIADLFETITFYENRTEQVTYTTGDRGKYLIELQTRSKKIRADELGTETEIPMEDLVDVGIYDNQGQLAYLQKHLIKTGENIISIEVDFEPSQAGLDPLNKLIDKVSEGHLKKATLRLQ